MVLAKISKKRSAPVYIPAHMDPTSAAIDVVQRTEKMIFGHSF